MSYYSSLVHPLLRLGDGEAMHDRVLRALQIAQGNAVGRAILRFFAGEIPENPVDVFGLRFPNAIGVAAGFDKDARAVRGLSLLGFGHVEVGTLTPRPQAGNPKPRVFRLPEDRAVINRMGFPNGGAQRAAERLRKFRSQPHNVIVGVSIGKQKETPLADATGDYLAVLREVHPFADYIAVNISSPNTPGLRELQGGRWLSGLCRDLVNESAALANGARRKPILVKIAPDLSDAELDEMLAAFLETGIDGVIATNTTLSRPALRASHRDEQGGLSGRPLAGRSTELIARIVKETGGRLPVIGVGGIFTAEDAREKLDAGARLVQVYTGMIYEGPGIAGKILRGV